MANTGFVHGIDYMSEWKTGSCAEKKEFFLDTLNDLNLAIETFIHRYETEHEVNVTLNTDWIGKLCLRTAATYFISGLLQLNFTFQIGSRPFQSSVIIKIPQLGALEDYGRHMQYYDREIYVYEEALPRMYRFWSGPKLTPNFYGSTESGLLVLENLHESGFYAKPRGALLDVSACRIVLKALAQFHALSVDHVNEFRGDTDSLKVLNRDKGKWASEIYPRLVHKMRKYILPSCSESTRNKFGEYVDSLSSTIDLGFSPNVNGFNVILHGDAHLHNVLFKSDHDNNVTECKLIDFQNSHRGSPIVDIMQFFVTSVEFADFAKNYVPLFRHYLRELKSIMKETNARKECPYGLQDLLADFEKYKMYFLFYFTSHMPIYCAGQLDTGSNTEENSVDTLMKSAKYISVFDDWVNYLLSTT